MTLASGSSTQSWCGALIGSPGPPNTCFGAGGNFGRWAYNLFPIQENIDTSSALGQALFTIVSAVAQLERDLIRERVSAGDSECAGEWQEAWSSRSGVDRERILELKTQGHSLRQIATNLGVGYGTVGQGSE